MSIALQMTPQPADRALRLSLVTAAFVCAVVGVRTLPVKMEAISEFPLPLCAADAAPGNKVEIVNSYAIPDMPGKRVTVVRVTYGPGGFTPAHRHGGIVTAYITKGQIKSQLNDGPVEIFEVGQSFFEPMGTIQRLLNFTRSGMPRMTRAPKTAPHDDPRPPTITMAIRVSENGVS